MYENKIKNAPNILWVVFEGPDRTGKSTLLHDTATILRACGYQVQKTAEPTYHDPYGKQVRSLIKSGCTDAAKLLPLFSGDRFHHLAYKIIPLLTEPLHPDKPTILLQDRYYLSTAFYQGEALGIRAEMLTTFRHLWPSPDLWVLCPYDCPLYEVRDHLAAPRLSPDGEVIEDAKDTDAIEGDLDRVWRANIAYQDFAYHPRDERYERLIESPFVPSHPLDQKTRAESLAKYLRTLIAEGMQ